ncbi:MAG: hypothetical protein LUC33_02690 [Prevotellaceae bacterium]|nr:hypothetical protein [Prevotellaceae bacterium]
MRYNIEINLSALPTAELRIRKENGHKMLRIDLDASPAVSQWRNGTWHLALTAWELKAVAEGGDTHLLKPNLGKAERESMTEEQRGNLPIVGHLRPVPQQQQQRPKPEPTALPQTNDPEFFEEKDDDLPF